MRTQYNPHSKLGHSPAGHQNLNRRTGSCILAPAKSCENRRQPLQGKGMGQGPLAGQNGRVSLMSGWIYASWNATQLPGGCKATVVPPSGKHIAVPIAVAYQAAQLTSGLDDWWSSKRLGRGSKATTLATQKRSQSSAAVLQSVCQARSYFRLLCLLMRRAQMLKPFQHYSGFQKAILCNCHTDAAGRHNTKGGAFTLNRLRSSFCLSFTYANAVMYLHQNARRLLLSVNL